MLIIDEAHNLAPAIESSYSVGITLQTLQNAFKSLSQYKSKYGARLNPKNLMFVKQLLQVIMGLVKDLRSAAKSTSHSVLTVREIIQSAKLENLDLFEIINYMARSQISNKVKGFQEKASKEQPKVEARVNPLKKMLDEKKQKSQVEEEQVSENNKENSGLEGFGMAPLLQVESFLTILLAPGADLRLIKNTRESQTELKIFLLNPATVFADLCKEARAVILAGGTMKPYQTLKDQLLAELKPERVSWFR